MSAEFAEMLRETLNKMQERITYANNQWEAENEETMLKKFEEFSLGKWLSINKCRSSASQTN